MFRILIAAGLFLPVAAFSQQSGQSKDSSKPESSKPAGKSAAKQKSGVAPQTTPDAAEKVDKMPNDVVEVRTDIFRRVDENGKAWIYRRMPFGIFKSAETENMRQILANPPDKQNVRELPDGTLEFTKLTPFGIGKYTRKKADLTDEEKEFWEKAKQEKGSGSQKKATKEQQK